MSMYDQKQVEQLRKRYPKGTRLCLDFMDEPGMPPGLQGTVSLTRRQRRSSVKSMTMPLTGWAA